MSAPNKKRTFLDTCVLINAFCGTEEISQKAMVIIDDPDREFIASDFLSLELLPKPTFNKKEDAVAFYTEYLLAVSDLVKITPEVTSEALTLACNFGLGPIDALHFQAAINADVSEFFTSEKRSRAFFNINNLSITVTSLTN